MQCATHPSVETELACSRCGKPICPRCLVITPVGARCRECARLRRLPTYRLGTVFILRGLGAALAAGARRRGSLGLPAPLPPRRIHRALRRARPGLRRWGVRELGRQPQARARSSGHSRRRGAARLCRQKPGGRSRPLPDRRHPRLCSNRRGRLHSHRSPSLKDREAPVSATRRKG